MSEQALVILRRQLYAVQSRIQKKRRVIQTTNRPKKYERQIIQTEKIAEAKRALKWLNGVKRNLLDACYHIEASRVELTSCDYSQDQQYRQH